MRLDRFIANNSDYSRSDIRKLVKAGCVYVNNELATTADLTIAPSETLVTVNNERVYAISNLYYMLHKPVDVVCANTDSQHSTVIDLMHEHLPLHVLSSLQIAGRLDIDTTGLVLITNDGQWNHRVTSPANQCYKKYRVDLELPINTDIHELFSNGILLEGETKKTKPAEIELINSTQCLLTICEGKYHQVKRMFAAVGNKVVKLHRCSIGNILLDEKLQPGQYRKLYPQEVESI